MDRLLWGTMMALLLAPVWMLPWFPTQDGGSHVENAAILLRLLHGSPAIFGEFFAVNTAPTPNWLGHAVLAALMAVFGPAAAEKILVSVCLAGLPLAARYALSGLRKDAGPLAVLAFPLAFNCLLHYGFYNFCLGLPLFFVVLGMWLRGARLPVTALMLVLLYGCHVVAWGIALLAMAVYRGRAVVRLALVAAPSIVLAGSFFWSRASGGGAVESIGFGPRWYGLTHFTTSVFSFADAHQRAGAALSLFFIGAAAVALFRRSPKPAVALSTALLVFYFVAPPGGAGGSALLERLNLFFFLSLVLTIGAADWGARARGTLTAGAALGTAMLLALNLPWYREANRQAAEMLTAAPHIPPATAWVPLLYDARGTGPLRDLYGETMRHVPSYLAATTASINLDNYEAQTELFPVRFREGHNPGALVGGMEELPPRVRLDWPAVRAVLVWDPGRQAASLPPDFALAFTSTGGAARVYRRR
jgi:hypothetical protein